MPCSILGNLRRDSDAEVPLHGRDYSKQGLVDLIFIPWACNATALSPDLAQPPRALFEMEEKPSSPRLGCLATRFETMHGVLIPDHDPLGMLVYPRAIGRRICSSCQKARAVRPPFLVASVVAAMKKSAWGTKPGREVVLAVWVRRKFIADCLAKAVCSDTFGSTPPPTSAAIASALSARPRRSNSGATVRPCQGSDSGPVSGSITGHGTSSRGGSRSTAPPSLREEHRGSPSAMPPPGSSSGSWVTESAALQTSNGARVRAAEEGEDGGVNESTRIDDAVPGVSEQGMRGGEAGEAEVGAAFRGEGGGVAAVSEVGQRRQGIELGSPPDDGDGLGSDGRRRAKARSQALGVGNGGVDDSANDGDRRVRDAVRLHWEPERQPSGEKVLCGSRRRIGVPRSAPT